LLEVNGRKISISCYYNIMVNITEQTVGIYWPLVCSVFLLLLLFWSRFVIYYTHCVANTLLFSHNIFHSETEDKRATVYSRRRVREISAFFFFCLPDIVHVSSLFRTHFSELKGGRNAGSDDGCHSDALHSAGREHRCRLELKITRNILLEFHAFVNYLITPIPVVKQSKQRDCTQNKRGNYPRSFVEP